MKKLIFSLIAVLTLLTVSAYAEGTTYSFENTTDGLSTVTNSLAGGGSASYTDGFIGRGLALNGSYGLHVGSVSGDFTISAMVNITSSGGTQTVFFKNMGSSSSENWTSVILDNGTPAFWARGGNYSWTRLVTANDNVLAKWAYITYTEENGVGSLYVNGKLAGSKDITVGGGEIYAAATYWSADAPKGILDELYFNSSEALSAEEIMAMYTDLAIRNVSLPSETITDLDLPTAIGNAQVRWVSSNESVITNSGKVTRGDENVTVTLSLYMGDELLATYEVTVLKSAVSTNKSVVLSYIFDANTAGVVEDASGNGNHGTIHGGMVGTHFDGADDYVEMPPNLLADLDEFTIVMRLKPEIAKTHQFTFNFGSGTGKYFFLNTSRPTTNTLRLALTQNGSGAEKDVASLPGLRDGEYAALAITVSGSEAVMYQNGIPVAAGDLGISPSELGNTTDNWLAKSPYPDPYFRGDIYEFTIYPRVLSADEIETMHYQAPEEKNYISDMDFKNSELTVYLNRFCMVSAVITDDSGEIVHSTTAKVSGDNLTAKFTLPKGIFNAELAAYDADRGIVRDRIAMEIYNDVVVYSLDGDNVIITNATDKDLSVKVMAAAYKDDGSLASLNVVTVDVSAESHQAIKNPANTGEKLLVWYSLDSLEPITAHN